jgi:hypothetical protein
MKSAKCLLISITIVFILLCFTIESFAQGDASTYKVTVQSIQLKTVAGTWVTIASPNQVLDIASVSAGATAGSFLNDAVIPVGTYDNFKVVLSETMIFAGNDGARYTRAGGNVTVTGADGNAASTATWAGFPPNANLTENAESYQATAPGGEVTANLDLDTGDADNYIEVYGRNDLTNPVTVTENSTISMSFDFDTQGTVIWTNAGDGNIMFFTPPQSGTRFEMTVDGRSITITEAQMRIDF